MAKLKELSEYKITILSRLIESQDLCKAVYYPDRDFLSMPDIDPYSLLYTYQNPDPEQRGKEDHRLYPYKHVPDEVQDESKTFINLDFQKFQKAGNSFKSGFIYIHVLCHNSVVPTVYNQTRYDYICNLIEDMMNNEHGVGIGKLEFWETSNFTLSNRFVGQYVCYKPVSFNV